MSTTIHVYVPEHPVEATCPLTIEFHWEGTPMFAYGLSVEAAQALVRDLLCSLNMLQGVVQPVVGTGEHRQVGSASHGIDAFDIPYAEES